MNLLRYIGRTALRRVIWIVVGLLTFAVIDQAHADWEHVTCGIFGCSPPVVGPFGSTEESAAPAVWDTLCSNWGLSGHDPAYTPNVYQVFGTGPYHARVKGKCLGNPNQPYIQITYNVGSCQPPGVEGTDANGQPTCEAPAPECPLVVGEEIIVFGTTATPPATQCVGNCERTAGPFVQFSDGWVAGYTVTGNCGADSGTTDTQDGLNCIASSDGATVCLDPTDTNCGTVNGEYVCLDSVPPGNCVLTPGGQAICDAGTQTDPPDSSFDDENGDGYDVYNDGNTGGETGGTGATGGTSDVGAGGDGVGPEGETVTPGAVPGANETLDGWGTITQGFLTRVEAAPLVAAIGTLPGSLPAGSCAAVDSDPIAWFDGQTLTIDAQCGLWDDISPVLYGVMLAAWSLLGALIILRA